MDCTQEPTHISIGYLVHLPHLAQVVSSKLRSPLQNTPTTTTMTMTKSMMWPHFQGQYHWTSCCTSPDHFLQVQCSQMTQIFLSHWWEIRLFIFFLLYMVRTSGFSEDLTPFLLFVCFQGQVWLTVHRWGVFDSLIHLLMCLKASQEQTHNFLGSIYQWQCPYLLLIF